MVLSAEIVRLSKVDRNMFATHQLLWECYFSPCSFKQKLKIPAEFTHEAENIFLVGISDASVQVLNFKTAWNSGWTKVRQQPRTTTADNSTSRWTNLPALTFNIWYTESLIVLGRAPSKECENCPRDIQGKAISTQLVPDSIHAIKVRWHTYRRSFCYKLSSLKVWSGASAENQPRSASCLMSNLARYSEFERFRHGTRRNSHHFDLILNEHIRQTQISQRCRSQALTVHQIPCGRTTMLSAQTKQFRTNQDRLWTSIYRSGGLLAEEIRLNAVCSFQKKKG